MNIPFPFEPLLCFGWLGIMMLAGIVLRAKLTFFQRFLIPSCLIGGMIGIVLLHLGVMKVSPSMLETFAYHLFIISFISLGLTPGEKSEKPGSGKDIVRGAVWMALIEGITLPLQALIGGGVVIVYGLFGSELFPTFGFLAPLGFTEGPGQALSIGKVWEQPEFGFQFAATIGLAFAAAGYIAAFLVGVPLCNRGIRKGQAVNAPRALPRAFLRGLSGKDEPKESAGLQTTHSGNVDTLAFHLSLVGLVYILTYALIEFAAGMMQPKMADMLWGFFFFAGLFVALLVRFVMTKIGVIHTVDRGIQRRITGWSVDFLIVSTVMAIQLVVLWDYIVPVLLISILCTVATTMVIVYLGNRIWSNNLERMVAMYGTCTGTVSTGLLLLRIVDPEFKTQTALELGLMNIFVAPIVLGAMLMVSAPLLWNWSLGFTMLMFLIMMVACLAAIKLLNMWGPKRA